MYLAWSGSVQFRQACSKGTGFIARDMLMDNMCRDALVLEFVIGEMSQHNNLRICVISVFGSTSCTGPAENVSPSLKHCMWRV